MLVSSRAICSVFLDSLDRFALIAKDFLDWIWIPTDTRFFALSALHYLCTLYSAFLAWGGAQQFLLVWFAATRSKVREQRGSVQQRCMQQSP